MSERKEYLRHNSTPPQACGAVGAHPRTEPAHQVHACPARAGEAHRRAHAPASRTACGPGEPARGPWASGVPCAVAAVFTLPPVPARLRAGRTRPPGTTRHARAARASELCRRVAGHARRHHPPRRQAQGRADKCACVSERSFQSERAHSSEGAEASTCRRAGTCKPSGERARAGKHASTRTRASSATAACTRKR
jgi:hypothetical protein